MYTIRQAAIRTGLSVALLRVWERRYGVVEPTRTPAGYRLYDDDAIARLAAMQQLVTEGWAPRQAAQRVLEPGVDLRALRPAPAGEASPPTTSPDLGPTGLPSSVRSLASRADDGQRDLAIVAGFLTAARDLDVPAMDRILDECFAAQRFELAIEGAVSPALRAIGSSWAEGTIDVAHEHAASETIRRRLARFFDAAGTGDRVPRVIVGLPPGGQHEIGAFAFSVAGRRAGLDILYLGANVPVESWLRGVRETRASVVVLGVVTLSDVDSAHEVVEALRSAADPPICLFGGPCAADAQIAPDEAGTVTLPASLDAAVAAVVEILDSIKRPAI